jgi:hypothetical protein
MSFSSFSVPHPLRGIDRSPKEAPFNQHTDPSKLLQALLKAIVKKEWLVVRWADWVSNRNECGHWAVAWTCH